MNACLRLAIGLALMMGCHVKAVRGNFGAISTRALPVASEILQRDAEGLACLRLLDEDRKTPSFRVALDLALEEITGADALMGADLDIHDGCFRVRGTAVKLW